MEQQQSEKLISNNEEEFNDISSGVSLENAAYIENNINNVQENTNNKNIASNNIIEEYTPKLFSEEKESQESTIMEANENIEKESEELFDQDMNEEEDFEIPAFLRKQKF